MTETSRNSNRSEQRRLQMPFSSASVSFQTIEEGEAPDVDPGERMIPALAFVRSTPSVDVQKNGNKNVYVQKTDSSANDRKETRLDLGWPFKAYPINQDPDPELIVKQTNKELVYQQEVSFRI